MKKFVISLENAFDRREHIKAEFENKNVSYEFFNAINHTQIDDIARELDIPINNTRLGKNEIACFLSHASIWQLVVDNSYPHMCIFEDDIILGKDSDFYLNNVLDWKPDNAHILKFEVYNRMIKIDERFKRVKIGDRELVKLATKHTGCAGYIITLETAQFLLDIVRNCKELIPVDHVVFGDFLYNYESNIYQIVPAICIQSQNHQHVKPLKSYLETERNERYGKSINNKKSENKIIKEGKRLLKQPGSIIQKVKLRLKGVKELRLTFR